MSEQTTVVKPDRYPNPGGQLLVRGGNPAEDYSYRAVSRLRKHHRPSLVQTLRPTR